MGWPTVAATGRFVPSVSFLMRDRLYPVIRLFRVRWDHLGGLLVICLQDQRPSPPGRISLEALKPGKQPAVERFSPRV